MISGEYWKELHASSTQPQVANENIYIDISTKSSSITSHTQTSDANRQWKIYCQAQKHKAAIGVLN